MSASFKIQNRNYLLIIIQRIFARFSKLFKDFSFDWEPIEQYDFLPVSLSTVTWRRIHNYKVQLLQQKLRYFHFVWQPVHL